MPHGFVGAYKTRTQQGEHKDCLPKCMQTFLPALLAEAAWRQQLQQLGHWAWAADWAQCLLQDTWDLSNASALHRAAVVWLHPEVAMPSAVVQQTQLRMGINVPSCQLIRGLKARSDQSHREGASQDCVRIDPHGLVV